MASLKNAFPLLDGVPPSWADVSVGFTPSPIALPGGLPGGLPGVGALLEMSDIYAINTSRTLDVGKTRAGGRVTGGTTGQLDQEASITLYRAGYQKFAGNLATVAPIVRTRQRAISLVKFDIQFKFTPPGSVSIYHRILRGCRVVGDTMNGQEGPDAQQVEVPLYVLEIVDVINGQEIVLI